jgi:hypothetical protein
MARDRYALQTGQLLTKTQAIEQAQAPPEDPVGCHHRTSPEMSGNSVARGMPIMYISCESSSDTQSMSLTCNYSSQRSDCYANSLVTGTRPATR